MAPETTDNKNQDTLRYRDLEVKDAQLIFYQVWNDLERECGRENLCFPREIFWLNGAPGAGKGTNSRFIMDARGLTADPIVISDLLDSPEAKRLKDAGVLAGDREVVALLLRRLLNPAYQSGAIVDGFPRTQVQVECLKLLYRKLLDLRNEFAGTPLYSKFHKPFFHIMVLFVDEAESVRRQLKRGKEIEQYNQEVERTGIGEKKELRKTDLSADAARNRYRVFKEVTFEALTTLKELFHYHFINAQASLEQVQNNIIQELKYQSSLELDQQTFDALSVIPIASDMIVHARQELVKRLDRYVEENPALFHAVIELIHNKFIPIIRSHSISGRALISTEAEVMSNPLALGMLIDIFSERGYHAVVDIRKESIPDKIDLQTGKIHCITKKVFRIRLDFPGSEIRRG
jgi:adenylate kinase